MDSYPHTRRTETAGRWLGDLARRLRYRSARVPVFARILLLAVGVAIVAALVLMALWLALVFLCVFIAVKLLPHIGRSSESDEPEWRQGLLGFGLYDQKGFRIDPHDPKQES